MTPKQTESQGVTRRVITHTPGPWRVLRGEDAGKAEFGASHSGKYVAVFGADNEPICSSGDKCYHPHPLAEKNADIIAAAPELLAACKALLEITCRAFPAGLPVELGTHCEEQDWNNAQSEARHAIVRATAHARAEVAA